MDTLTINYGVSRKAPRTPAKRRRRIQTQRGTLKLDGGVWLDEATRDQIFDKICAAHPGWSVMGFTYVSGPHDGGPDAPECQGCGDLACGGDCGVWPDDDYEQDWS